MNDSGTKTTPSSFNHWATTERASSIKHAAAIS